MNNILPTLHLSVPNTYFPLFLFVLSLPSFLSFYTFFRQFLSYMYFFISYPNGFYFSLFPSSQPSTRVSIPPFPSFLNVLFSSPPSFLICVHPSIVSSFFCFSQLVQCYLHISFLFPYILLYLFFFFSQFSTFFLLLFFSFILPFYLAPCYLYFPFLFSYFLISVLPYIRSSVSSTRVIPFPFCQSTSPIFASNPPSPTFPP